MLPPEQEAHEVPRSDGLNLAPPPLPGVGVDARQQPTRAVLLRPARSGEVAADGEALRLKPSECAQDQRLAQPRVRRQCRRCGRTTALQVTAKEVRRCCLLVRLLGSHRAWMIRNGV